MEIKLTKIKTGKKIDLGKNFFIFLTAFNIKYFVFSVKIFHFKIFPSIVFYVDLKNLFLKDS
jgi:hypothetical protein